MHDMNSPANLADESISEFGICPRYESPEQYAHRMHRREQHNANAWSRWLDRRATQQEQPK